MLRSLSWSRSSRVRLCGRARGCHTSDTCGWARIPLRRRFTPGLLRDQVGGIPSGPVLVLARPRALLVLEMSGLGTPQRVLQVVRGSERRFRGVDPAREPRGDFLDDPRIAVGIVEGEERPVAGAL